MNRHFQDALQFFLPNQDITTFEPLGEGNVNDTWKITVPGQPSFVLQRLNPHVFANPGLVQDNLHILSSHLLTKCRLENPDFIPLQLCPAPSGAISYVAPDGAWWRLLNYIDNSRTIATVTTEQQAREIGRCLGLFHQLTASLAPDTIHDPLPGFHCTPCYLEAYDIIIPVSGRHQDEQCRQCINGRRQDVFMLENARKQATISMRVVHGDPKAANFLFAREDSRVISLIDLDTLRPGLLLHDLGDCLRSCCNTAGEEQRAEDVYFDPEIFVALLKGYRPFARNTLCMGDLYLLTDSVRLIAFELGLRFYTDYLAGDVYFKTQYPQHNLYRAQAQFALVQSIERQQPVLNVLGRDILQP